jgi:formate dehydrogenase maturation protein FdhE
MGKLATPDWILKGKSKPDKKKEKGKTFKLRKCPKCGGTDVNVIIGGEEGKGTRGWECKKCKWNGKNIDEEEVSEDEFMKYLDEKGEEVA